MLYIRFLSPQFHDLKINMRREGHMIFLSIENYIDKMAKDFGMETCRTYYTPMEKGHELSKLLSPEEGSDEYRKMRKTPYRSLLGALQYMLQRRAQISRGRCRCCRDSKRTQGWLTGRP